MRTGVVVALVAWAACCVCIGGILLVQHLVALPVPPSTDPQLAAAIAALPGPDASWRMVHVMYRSCPCSRRTIAYLIERAHPDRVTEIAMVVDDLGAAGPEDMALRDAGFTVEVITPDDLHARFHLEAAPLLAVARPDGSLGYVGGYARHKQSAVYEDVEILADLRDDTARAPLPAFGCPTSDRLARLVDPLGLRSW